MTKILLVHPNIDLFMECSTPNVQNYEGGMFCIQLWMNQLIMENSFNVGKKVSIGVTFNFDMYFLTGRQDVHWEKCWSIKSC
jgi:hypothetical protein